jgi:putative cell wall-binding protein
MASHDRILCKKCRGENDRGARFCWYCGAPLRGGARRSRVQEVVIDLTTRASKWVLFLGVLAGLVVGAYYALDHYLWPAVGSETTIAQTAPTTSVPKTTTTVTTLPPRSDRSVAGGTDRYATAIGISKLAFPDGAPALVLVPGDDYAQGMIVAPLAAAYKGAVLLVPPEGIRDDLAAEITRLGPTEVFLVGVPRPNTITKQLQAVLKEPTVTRLIGEDPYETAALVAGAVKAKVGTVSKVVVVPSDSFVEALSVAPLAAANGWPILLTPRVGAVPRTTRNAIADLGVTSALVVGTDAELALDQVDRQVGADSFETAALVVRYAVTQGLTFTHTAIVTGTSFPDGLIAGSYLALDRGILILIKDGDQPGSLLSVLNANLDEVRVIDFIAVPELAKQMAAGRATGSSGTASTTTTATGPNGSGASGTSEPSTEGDTQTTIRPSAGGW